MSQSDSRPPFTAGRSSDSRDLVVDSATVGDSLSTLQSIPLPGRIYEATGGRFSAAAYDRMSAGSERAGLSDMRHQLLAGARGATLELGAGTGANLQHYPDAVTELVLTEPSEHM